MLIIKSVLHEEHEDRDFMPYLVASFYPYLDGKKCTGVIKTALSDIQCQFKVFPPQTL